jgi:hypothetical protein
MAMDPKRKRVLLIGAGVAALYLLYRWYSNNQANAAAASAGSTAATTDPTAASDYASIAGQEQSDVAALQSQNQQLMTQEQSDVQALQQSQTSGTTQEQTDVTALGNNQTTLGNAITGITTVVQNLATGVQSTLSGVTATQTSQGSEIAALAAGQAKANRLAANLASAPGLSPGALRAPWSKTKPAAKAGYNLVGQGGGWWEYVPTKKK